MGKTYSDRVVEIEEIRMLYDDYHRLGKTPDELARLYELPTSRIYSLLGIRCEIPEDVVSTDTTRRSKHYLYLLYRSMIQNAQRCCVNVCDEWRTSFNAFVAYIEGEGLYQPPPYCFCRIDPAQGYYPGNVHFIIRKKVDETSCPD